MAKLKFVGGVIVTDDNKRYYCLHDVEAINVSAVNVVYFYMKSGYQPAVLQFTSKEADQVLERWALIKSSSISKDYVK